MGTERSVEYEGPCNCGHGSYRIDECTPDHGWPTATPLWYEPRIDCAHCCSLYEIKKRGKQFVLIEKSKLQQREVLQHDAHVRGGALMMCAAVQPALQALELLLTSQQSVAAICRVLKTAGLTDRSEPSFRNHWNGPKAWIQSNIRPSNLGKVLTLVNIAPNEVTQELSAILQLSAAAYEAVEPFGSSIYELA